MISVCLFRGRLSRPSLPQPIFLKWFLRWHRQYLSFGGSLDRGAPIFSSEKVRYRSGCTPKMLLGELNLGQITFPSLLSSASLLRVPCGLGSSREFYHTFLRCRIQEAGSGCQKTKTRIVHNRFARYSQIADCIRIHKQSEAGILWALREFRSKIVSNAASCLTDQFLYQSG